MKTIAITIEDDILRRIDDLAESRRPPRNRSQFIREAVREYVVRLESLAQEERERELIHRHRDRLHREAMALLKGQAKL
jgi:metal-responsive CopG/Arc/MetJ family transcriptional regulator